MVIYNAHKKLNKINARIYTYIHGAGVVDKCIYFGLLKRISLTVFDTHFDASDILHYTHSVRDARNTSYVARATFRTCNVRTWPLVMPPKILSEYVLTAVIIREATYINCCVAVGRYCCCGAPRRPLTSLPSGPTLCTSRDVTINTVAWCSVTRCYQSFKHSPRQLLVFLARSWLSVSLWTNDVTNRNRSKNALV